MAPGFDACRRAFGHDFLAFYAAGTLVREGRTAELYDLGAIAQVERETTRSADLDAGGAVGPWWNPPVYAWAIAPLAALPFGNALLIWTALNIAAAGAAAWLLAREAAPASRSFAAVTALLLFSSAPFVQSITHGQNSGLSLLLVTLAVSAWRGDRSFAAGACVGLLLYKPQLAAVLAAALVLHRGRRAAVGLLAVGGVVVLLTLATMPGALSDYLARLPLNLHTIQVERTYLWERHVTLKAFWRLLLQGRGAGETSWLVNALTLAFAAPLVAALPFAAIRARSRGTPDALIAATLAAAPLLMPFYFDYDLLLLAAAAALALPVTGRRLALWAGLYGWLFVNPYVAGSMRINITVPLLWTLAVVLTDAALHEQREGAPAAEAPDEDAVSLARAA